MDHSHRRQNRKKNNTSTRHDIREYTTWTWRQPSIQFMRDPQQTLFEFMLSLLLRRRQMAYATPTQLKTNESRLFVACGAKETA
jgi:hypothetical protein